MSGLISPRKRLKLYRTAIEYFVSKYEERITLSIRLWHPLNTPQIFEKYQQKFLSIYN